MASLELQAVVDERMAEFSTVAKLKEELARRGQVQKGLKAELQERLRAEIVEELSAGAGEATADVEPVAAPMVDATEPVATTFEHEKPEVDGDEPVAKRRRTEENGDENAAAAANLNGEAPAADTEMAAAPEAEPEAEPQAEPEAAATDAAPEAETTETAADTEMSEAPATTSEEKTEGDAEATSAEATGDAEAKPAEEEEEEEEEEEQVESEDEFEDLDEEAAKKLISSLSLSQLRDFTEKMAFAHLDSPHLLEIQKKAAKDPTKCRIFARGFPLDFDHEQLKEAFKQFGKVVDAEVILDKHTQKSRGFGFVTMKNAAHAQKAIETAEFTYKDSKISCNLANSRPEHQRGARRPYQSNYGQGRYQGGGGYNRGYQSYGGYNRQQGGYQQQGYGGGGYGQQQGSWRY